MAAGDIKSGRGELLHTPLTFMNIDFFRTAYGAENIAVLPGSLALAKEEISILLQRGVENGKQSPLENRLKIDHDISADNQIQLSKRRIGEHIVGRENNHPANIL